AFTDADREGTLPVAIVNRAFAAKHFPGVDPIGRRIRLGRSESKAPWLTIVGLVPDVYGGDPEDPAPAAVYQPFAQNHSNFAWISARTAGPPLGAASQLRGAVASLNRGIPLHLVARLASGVRS